MVHTLTITHQIKSPKVFDEIYKGLEIRVGQKPKKIGKGNYVTEELKEIGLTYIRLTNKEVNSKYKYNFMQISITVNPAKLIGSGQLEVMRSYDIEKVSKTFTKEIEKIHSGLPTFEYWIVNRIDYAINIETSYVNEYIKLFQRGDKPKSFKELYCGKAKMRKQQEGSLYLFNNSVTINFYNKESERLNQNFNKDGAKDLLRIEVQCKKPKINTLKTKNNFEYRMLGYYLSEEISNQQLGNYYNKIIGTGDYYTLSEAIRMIEDSNYTPKSKEKLIEVIKSVSKHKSIWEARQRSKYTSSSFNRYLNQIRMLNINPVTIPERWRIKYLKNILTKEKRIDII